MKLGAFWTRRRGGGTVASALAPVFIGGASDALRARSGGAERGQKRAVRPAQDQYIDVGFVQDVTRRQPRRGISHYSSLIEPFPQRPHRTPFLFQGQLPGGPRPPKTPGIGRAIKEPPFFMCYSACCTGGHEGRVGGVVYTAPGIYVFHPGLGENRRWCKMFLPGGRASVSSDTDSPCACRAGGVREL